MVRNWIANVVLALSLIFSPQILSGQDQKTPPNIVLIMADDLGWKDLHCYGNERLDTPSIDRFAKQGMQFWSAYSAASVCTPTRAALMTGEAPARLKITNHAGGHSEGFKLPGTKLALSLIHI